LELNDGIESKGIPFPLSWLGPVWFVPQLIEVLIN